MDYLVCISAMKREGWISTANLCQRRLGAITIAIRAAPEVVLQALSAFGACD
jgi:hypothetical protein